MNLGDGAKHYTVAENRELNRMRDALREEYSDFMVENKVDVILGPAYNNVAPHREKVYNESYTLIYNLLDFPALVFKQDYFKILKLIVGMNLIYNMNIEVEWKNWKIIVINLMNVVVPQLLYK